VTEEPVMATSAATSSGFQQAGGAKAAQERSEEQWCVVQPIAGGSDWSTGKRYPSHYCQLLRLRFDALRESMAELRELALSIGVPARVHGRIKSCESIHRKMRKRQLLAHEILDSIGVRVILDSVDQCYRLERKICETYARIDGHQRNYIIAPKLNGYQSLHTTVVGTSALPIEIQLRTRAMHESAESGSASHRTYKGVPKVDADLTAHPGESRQVMGVPSGGSLAHEVCPCLTAVATIPGSRLGVRSS